ncbi:Homeobox protein H17 [Armadillidium vulgare]|nr:Homeobox protein H17 [Armadillidium vulgare]
MNTSNRDRELKIGILKEDLPRHTTFDIMLLKSSEPNGRRKKKRERSIKKRINWDVKELNNEE